MADYIRPTPRNPILGLLADAMMGGLSYMEDPRRTQQLQGLAGLLSDTGIAQTVDRLASGEPLTKGKGFATKMKPETAAAAMTLGPEAVPIGRGAMAAARAAERGAMAAGRAGERYAERVVPQIMERGGLPAEMVSAMGQGTQSPLTVYHGSPYRFDRFDPTKIGSGEGAQAYGYGHYVAQAQDVAKEYANMPKFKQGVIENPEVLGRGAKDFINRVEKFGSIDKARQEAQELLAAMRKQNSFPSVQDQLATEIDLANRYGSQLQVKPTGVSPQLYTIDLPDPAIARMLDWDKRLSEQGNPALQQWFSSQKTYPGGYSYNEHTGETLYKALRERGLSADQASTQLQEAGIPGIRYLDQGSRGAGTGTSNFVVFPGEEELLKILSVNGGLLGP